MSRLAAITISLILGLFAAPSSANAQLSGKVYRIGYLTQGTLVAGD